MRRVHAFLLAVIVLSPVAGGAQPALAQSVPEALPAYQERLDRLSEVLGALHYLRGLCGKDEDQIWRNQMSGLMDTEATTPARRTRMTNAFNHGYNGFAESYRACTPAARLVADQYRIEGIALARDIASRYAE